MKATKGKVTVEDILESVCLRINLKNHTLAIEHFNEISDA